MDDLLTLALQKLLHRECTPQVVRASETGQGTNSLWAKITESGFADAMVMESEGGAGLGLAQAYPMLELCGTFAVPVPLAHSMIARALLAQAGVARPSGSIAISCASAATSSGLRCTQATFGSVADWILTSMGGNTILLPVDDAVAAAGVFPLDATLDWSTAVVQRGTRVPGTHDLETLEACATAAQIAGALVSVLDRTLQYANDREQFGRPIGKFQAVQHQLSVLAEHTFAAKIAAEIGCQSSSWTPQRLRVAVAKARTSEAAADAVAIAHAVHGAFGVTAECDLQMFTRRLNTWRRTASSESYWHNVLGEEASKRGGICLDVIRAIADAR